MMRPSSVALAALAGTVDSTIPAGTDIPVTLDEDIPIESDRIGDSFEAHVTRDVMVNGEVVIAGGVARGGEAGRERDRAARGHPAPCEGARRRRHATRERGRGQAPTPIDAASAPREKTAVGAAAGAVIGAVTGAGVLEGAVVGAGGGLAWGLLDDQDSEVDDGTPLSFALEEELEL